MKLKRIIKLKEFKNYQAYIKHLQTYEDEDFSLKEVEDYIKNYNIHELYYHTNGKKFYFHTIVGQFVIEIDNYRDIVQEIQISKRLGGYKKIQIPRNKELVKDYFKNIKQFIDIKNGKLLKIDKKENLINKSIIYSLRNLINEIDDTYTLEDNLKWNWIKIKSKLDETICFSMTSRSLKKIMDEDREGFEKMIKNQIMNLELIKKNKNIIKLLKSIEY